jgi:hypothetical protein
MLSDKSDTESMLRRDDEIDGFSRLTATILEDAEED